MKAKEGIISLKIAEDQIPALALDPVQIYSNSPVSGLFGLG